MDAASFERLTTAVGIPRFAASMAARSCGHTRELGGTELVQDLERRTPRISESVEHNRPGPARFLTEAGGPMRQSLGFWNTRPNRRGSSGGGAGCSWPRLQPASAGNRREWPGSTAAGWARWPTARVGCSWPTSAAGPAVGKVCICPLRWTT